MSRNSVRGALKAAMLRVGIYRCLDAMAFEAELQCQLQSVPIKSTGEISWRRFELGQRLFSCLGEAQNWRCCYCASPMSHVSQPMASKAIQSTLEHVIPLSRGGPDHPDNMVVACLQCNQLRGNQHVDEFLRQVVQYR